VVLRNRGLVGGQPERHHRHAGKGVVVAWLLLAVAPALAQEGGFGDGPNGAAIHTSGFVCPPKVGTFERDATGLRDAESGADYCAYSGLSGVYGTVIIRTLPSPFDPKNVLAPEFRVQEGTDGHLIGEEMQRIAAIPVYTRVYETARLQSRQYRTLYASTAVGAWSVVVIVEYAYPQDKDMASAFLAAIYGKAVKDIGVPAGP
jgi:hypothetical protein